MLPVLIVAVAVVLVVVIGLLFVGWGVGKTREMPPQITVDMYDAFDFCSEALPDEVTARITFEDLRRLLRYHLEWVQFYHWSPEGSDETPVFYEQLDAVDYVAERAEFWHLDVTRSEVEAVVRAHDAFLQFSGAVAVADPELVQEDLAEVAALALDDGVSRPELSEGNPSEIPSPEPHGVQHSEHQEEGGGPTV